jgi:tetratricopeptide (TPR) repeat protein
VSDSEQQPSRRAKRRAEAATERSEESGDSTDIKDKNLRLREEAAAKRRSKRDKERKIAVGQGLDASEMVDDALARSTHTITRWLKDHFNKLQWALVALIAGATAWTIYGYRTRHHDQKASDALMLAVAAEQGKVTTEDDLLAPESEGRMPDTRPTYSNEKARVKAAREAYEKAVSQHKDWDGATLGQMGLAGTLLDEGKYKEARELYATIRNSKLAATDGDVKGRAIEGMGLASEGLNDSDAALRAYRELENSDVFGIRPLAQYHQARLLFAQGKKDEAKALLKKVLEKLGKPSDTVPAQPQLTELARRLLAQIDPKEAEALSQQSNMITPEMLQQLEAQGGMKDPEKLKELLKALQQKPQGLPAPTPDPEQPGPTE